MDKKILSSSLGRNGYPLHQHTQICFEKTISIEGALCETYWFKFQKSLQGIPFGYL